MIQKYFGNDEKIRKQLLELVSMLNRWYQVKEDLLFAFEKCSESNIGEPTKSLVKDFIVRIRGGLSIEHALDLFSGSYTSPQFKSFAMQIRFNLRYRGNTGELLDNLETQLSRIDEEFTRRKIESSKDRLYLMGVFIASPIITLIVFIMNKSARELFLGEFIGVMLIVLAFLCYGIGLVIYLMSLKKNL